MTDLFKTYEFFGIQMVKETFEDSLQQSHESEASAKLYDRNNQPKVDQLANKAERKAHPSIQSCHISGAELAEMSTEKGEIVPTVSQWRIYKNVVAISAGFTILFWSFNAVANIQSSINKILGITALWVIYITFIVSCMFVPSIVISRLKPKWTMPLCMIPYSLYIAAQFYPRYWTLVPSGFLVGLAAAPLWSSKSSYITEISVIYSVAHKKNKEFAIARMFGIFFFIFNLSKIIGNYIVSAVLSFGTESIAISFESQGNCGTDFCPADLQNLSSFGTGKPMRDEREQLKVTILMGILFGCSILAAIMMSILVDPLSSLGAYNLPEETSTGKSLMLATFRHLRKKRQLLIIPLTFWSGIQNAFLSVDFTVAYITCSSGVALIGYVFICYGVMDAIFSGSLGYLVKFTGRMSIYSVGALLSLGTLITLLFWEPKLSNQLGLFIIAGLWGIGDAIWQTQTNALYGALFSEDPKAAFSNYNLWKSAGFMTAYIFSGSLCMSLKIYILIGNLIFAMIGYFWLELLQRSSIDFKLNEEPDIKYNGNMVLKKKATVKQ